MCAHFKTAIFLCFSWRSREKGVGGVQARVSCGRSVSLSSPEAAISRPVLWFLTGPKHRHQITGTQIRAQNQYGTGSREGPITRT